MPEEPNAAQSDEAETEVVIKDRHRREIHFVWLGVGGGGCSGVGVSNVGPYIIEQRYIV